LLEAVVAVVLVVAEVLVDIDLLKL